MLHSISQPVKIIEGTFAQPIQILCSDYLFYICKYNRFYPKQASLLINEWLGASFCRLWDLQTPESEIIIIKPEHIPANYVKHYFNHPCFGSRMLDDVIDLNPTVVDSLPPKKIDVEFLLKLTLFDLWLVNTDRRFDNYNLLLASNRKQQYQFYAIDHSFIFDNDSLKHGLNLLSFEESLLSSPFMRILIKNKRSDTLIKSNPLLERIEKSYYLCVDKCNIQVPIILEQMPDEWFCDHSKAQYQSLLNQHLFSHRWIDGVLQEFYAYLNKTVT